MTFSGARRLKRRYRELAHRLRHGKPNPLFDGPWYLARYPEVAASGMPAWAHYLEYGAAEGRQPSPLFLGRWYVAKYPDAARSGLDPLTHYATLGVGKGYNPNPVFDTSWYLKRNPDVAQSGINPLLHYARNGWREWRDPHPSFDLRAYFEHNPDVREAGIEPLAHYLAEVAAGRPRLKLTTQAVTSAAIRVCKRPGPAPAGRLCLFLAYAPGGRLRPHVETYLRALLDADLAVVLVVALDDVARDPVIPLLDRLAGVYLRENKGFDFGAWAHVLAIEPRLYRARLLVLANDSVFGPFRPADMHDILRRVEESPADVVALTDNHQRGWHLQSYFLAFKEQAISSFVFQNFMLAVQNLETRDEVIDEYELALGPALVAAGIRCEALFPSAADDANPTLAGWRELISRGFPFLKIAALRDPLPEADPSGWREVLAARGYDPGIVDATLQPPPEGNEAEGEGSGPGQRPSGTAASIPAAPERPLRVAFLGPWNYATGLGQAARGYMSALWRTPFEVNAYGFRKPFHTHGRTSELSEAVTFSGPADLAIVNLNPEAWPPLLDPVHRTVVAGAARRVGLWVWEMSQVPENWHPVFTEQDAVWGMSGYCAEVFRRSGAEGAEVMPPPVELDRAPYADLDPAAVRRGLDCPAEGRLVLYVFDGASYIIRKNPEALVEAFQRSGLSERGWTLVLKTKNLFNNVAAGARLARLVSCHPSIRLVNRALSRHDLMALFWAADVYASPHRSEGFGLTIAEAMAAGKVVVATDYGGSRDFLDATCGFPVKASLTRLEGDFGHYTRGGEWAEPDPDALVTALREAADEVETGTRGLAARARERIAERLSLEAVAARMKAAAEAVMRSDRALPRP